MREKLERIPISLCGVMLAYATLGFLLKDLGGTVYHVCSVVATVLFAILVLRLILCFDYVKNEMKDPIKCSVTATFSMGMILLTDYAQPVLGPLDVYFWIFAVAVHVYLLIFFNGHNIYQFDLRNVYATYFVFYAGLSTIADTAPNFGMTHVGVWFSKLSMALVFVMFLVITYRYIKLPVVENQNKALICTYTSPANLLIVGYLACDKTPLLPLITLLAFISIVAYVFSIYHVGNLMFKTFYPSFASFTFPFIVSALAMKRVNEYATSLGGASYLAWTKYVYPIQMVIAVFLILFVSIRFILSYIKQDV